MLRHPFTIAGFTLATVSMVHAGAMKEVLPPPAEVVSGSKSFGESGSLTEYFFGPKNAWDSLYDEVQAFKEANNLPISIGAHHWFHVDRDEYIYGDGYGVPGERGTYYYYLTLDPSIKLDGDGFINELGLHVQGRIRDSDDKLRPFYRDTVWTYEAYGYLKTDLGTFKAGQIVKEFGIPWDGTWWEGTPYFDGYSFDPDYGLSWGNTWKVSDKLSIDTALQFFFKEDGINGSIFGADAESFDELEERNTGVIRILPKWQLNEDTTLAWGFSGLAGEIDGSENFVGVDDSQFAFGTDLTLTYKNFSVFGEFSQQHGATSPARYVSGGPSDRITNARGGVSYKHGPITYHINYSKGWDDNPGGDQWIVDPGVSVQVAKNLTLYLEYVKWDVTNSQGVTSKFDDGFEIIFVWNY